MQIGTVIKEQANPRIKGRVILIQEDKCKVLWGEHIPEWINVADIDSDMLALTTRTTLLH